MRYLIILIPMLCYAESDVKEEIRTYCLLSKINAQACMIDSKYMSDFYRALGAHEAYQGIIDYLDDDM